MKKLTAGIFTVLIGLCAANSADAAIASKAWVEQDFATKTALNATNEEVAKKANAADVYTKNDVVLRIQREFVFSCDFENIVFLFIFVSLNECVDLLFGHLQVCFELFPLSI